MSASGVLRILLLDEHEERGAMIREALTALGHQVLPGRIDATHLYEQVRSTQPDVIIIDMDSPSRDVLENMRNVSSELPRPIVLFTAERDSERIRAAVAAGVSAYVVDGLAADRVQPVIDAARARFETFQAMRERLESAEVTLRERRDIERAKGILMQQTGLSEPEAYHRLRRMAMDRNMRLAVLAKSVIAAAELLAPQDRNKGDPS